MKRFTYVMLIWGVVSLGLTIMAEAGNPFYSTVDDKAAFQKTHPVWRAFQPVLNISHEFQKQFRVKLTSFARAMRRNPWGGSFWLFLCFSFLYGIFHAVGPGHGKSIAISYFLSRPGKVIHGFLMGNLLTFMHVFSAVMVILLLYFVLKITGLAQFEKLSGTFKIVSYSLLLLVGLYLAGKTIYELRNWQKTEMSAAADSPDLKSLVLTSLVTGLIPCPGAAIILSFSIIMQVTFQGLLAMVFIALGMGITTSSIAIVTIVSRKSMLYFIDKKSRLFVRIYAGLAFSGALAIIVISSLLLVESLRY